MNNRIILRTFAAALACAAATDATAAPLLTRNQNPLLALYGIPSPLPARLPSAGTGSIAGVINWTNFAATDDRGDVSYTLDGEVFETRLHIDHAIGDRWAIHGELAYRKLDEGSLDGLVSDWHGIFGMGDGSRNRLPEDDLLLEYNAAGASLLRVDEEVAGVADIPVALGYQVNASEKSALSVWFTLKAPVGSADDFTGSGAVDAALSVAAQAQVSEDWQLFTQANFAWLGEGDLLPELQEDYVLSALAGVTWNAWRGLDLTAQLEANSAIFDAGGTHFDGDAFLLTFGGDYRTAGGWQFDFGVSEDIEVDASPDVSFNIAVRHGF